jgi:hypothetical protein
MIISHSITKFRRFGVVVEECMWLNGEPYFSSESIGKWVGLAHPRRSVDRIVKKNPYILDYSKEVNVIMQKTQTRSGLSLGTNLVPSDNPDDKAISAKKSGQNYQRKLTVKKRFFDLMGFNLIVMESHTPVAKEYKAMIAKLAKMYLLGKLNERKPEEMQAEEILVKASDVQYGEQKHLIDLYMQKQDCSKATAYRHMGKIKAGESPFDKKYKGPTRDEAKMRVLEIREIFFQDPTLTAIEIWKALGGPKSPSYTTVKEIWHELKREYEAGKQFEIDLDENHDPVQ